MHWVLIFGLIFITITSIFSDDEESDEDDYLKDLPLDIEIRRENATSFISSYHHDMRAMGVSNKECDNARVC
jgi:hypothetical protein